MTEQQNLEIEKEPVEQRPAKKVKKKRLFGNLFNWKNWKFSRNIGIDLGTATVLVYVQGKGIVLQEPSVVAIDTNTDQILKVGKEAQQMLGRTPGNIMAVRPLRDGVISQYEVTLKMLQHFIKRTCGSMFFPPYRSLHRSQWPKRDFSWGLACSCQCLLCCTRALVPGLCTLSFKRSMFRLCKESGERMGLENVPENKRQCL